MKLQPFDANQQLENVKKIFTGVGEEPQMSMDTPKPAIKNIYPVNKEVIQKRRREMTPAKTDDPGVQYLNNNAPEGFMVDLPKAQKIIAFTQQEHPELEGPDLIKKAVDYLPDWKAYEDSKREQPKSKGFFGKSIDAIKNRGQSIIKNVKDFEQTRKDAIEQDGFTGGVKQAMKLPREAVQIGGDIAGAAGDVMGIGMMEIIESLPHFVKQPFKYVGNKLLEKPIVQEGLQKLSEGIEDYKAWSQENPEKAKTLESIYNVGELVTNIVGGGIAAKGAKQTIKTGTKVIDKGAGIAGKGIEKGTTGILGLTTGTSPDTIRIALKSAGTKDFTNALRGKIDDTQILQNVNKGLSTLKDNRRKLYGEAYDKLLESTEVVNVDEAAQSFYDKLFGKGGFGVVADVDDAGKISLDFTRSTISRGSPQEGVIKKVFSDLQQRGNDGDFSPASMDILKKRIGDYYRGTPEFAQTDMLVTDLTNSIADKITKAVPEYAEMNAKYAELSTLIRDVQGALSLGGKKQTTTAITKLKGALRRNQEFRQVMINEINQYADGDIFAQLAGSALNETMPRGLMGVASAGATLINPSFLAGLAAASPRIVGELANIVGIGTQKLKNAIDTASKIVKKGTDFISDNTNVLPIDTSTAAGNIGTNAEVE